MLHRRLKRCCVSVRFLKRGDFFNLVEYTVMRVSLAGFLLLLLAQSVDAQSFYAVRRERNLIATVGTGVANYFGELVNPGEIGKTRYNLIVGAEYYLTKR